MILQYRIHQILKDGTRWVSPVMQGSVHQASQEVIGGWASERCPGAAIEEGTGAVLCAVDANGFCTRGISKFFSEAKEAK